MAAAMPEILNYHGKVYRICYINLDIRFALNCKRSDDKIFRMEFEWDPAKNTKTQSRTDWSRLEAMSDDDIDYSDIPPLTDSFFQRAKLYIPEHRSVIADLNFRFKNEGKGDRKLLVTELYEKKEKQTYDVVWVPLRSTLQISAKFRLWEIQK